MDFFSQNLLCWDFVPDVYRKEHSKFSNIKKSGSIITSLNSHLRVHSFSSQTLGKSFTNVLVSLLCKMKIVQYIFYQHTWVTSAKKKSHTVELFVLEGMLKGHLVQLRHNERGQDNEQLDKVSQRLVSPHCWFLTGEIQHRSSWERFQERSLRKGDERANCFLKLEL